MTLAGFLLIVEQDFNGGYDTPRYHRVRHASKRNARAAKRLDIVAQRRFENAELIFGRSASPKRFFHIFVDDGFVTALVRQGGHQLANDGQPLRLYRSLQRLSQGRDILADGMDPGDLALRVLQHFFRLLNLQAPNVCHSNRVLGLDRSPTTVCRRIRVLTPG